MKRRIAFVFGTRPEFIKIARPVATLKKSKWAEPFIISTGQHEHLTRGIGKALGVKEDIHLDIGVPGQTLAGIVSAALPPVVKAYEEMGLQGVVVQGDAHSAFIGALAAYYCKLPVAHIEAGLRTEDKYAPFPEEMNRRLITQIADIHFAPTERAKSNVLREIQPEQSRGKTLALVTGNTEIDAAMFVSKKAAKKKLDWQDGRPLVLATAHRRESFGEQLESIFRGIVSLANRYNDHQFVLPLHPNPNVGNAWINAAGMGRNPVLLISPLDYMDCMAAIGRARLILTDSGGIQENAAAYGTPVLVLRNETERQEGIEAGCAKLAGTDEDTIFEYASTLLNDEGKLREMAEAKCPYGNGKASALIAKTLKKEWDHD